MKKTVAILLALVLIFSMVSQAVAASSATIVLGAEKFSQAGETKTITIEAKDLPSTELIQFVVKYDSAKVKLLNVSDGTDGNVKGRVIGAAGDIISDAVISNPVAGEINIVWENTVGISGSGTLAAFEFEALFDNAGKVKLEISENPDDEFIMRGNSDSGDNIEIEIEEEILGATLSGTVTSFLDSSENISIELFKNGESTASYKTTVSGNSAEYSISEIDAGTYLMKVSKAKHASFEAEIVVGTEDIEKDVKIYLKGDVNGDGNINMMDVTLIRRYLVNSTLYPIV